LEAPNRRAGELLGETITKGTKSPTLGDFDINANQSSRWQAIASIPEGDNVHRR
jgi:hypothetical protein